VIPLLVLAGLGASAAPTSSAVPAFEPPATILVEAAAPVLTRPAPVRDAPRRPHPPTVTPVAVPFECVVHLAEAAAKKH
jgi:hypothetical protein